jgi:hypothetical protein
LVADLNAVALVFQIFAIEIALAAVLTVSGSGGDFWSLVQPVLLLAGLTALTTVIASVQVGLGRYAGELVAAVMWQRVLHVATRVDLRKFESARFYDRHAARSGQRADTSYQITYGVVATIGRRPRASALWWLSRCCTLPCCPCWFWAACQC